MKDLQREILNEVAAGQITAAEGAARLESLGSPAAPVAVMPAPQPPAPLPPVRQVRVVSQFGSAEIVGDPSVAFAVADGPHRARQEGDTMVIEHAALDNDSSFSFGDGGRRIVYNGLDFQRRNLTVRMNPDLALIASVQAGNVRVEGVHGPITGDIQAGNCKVRDFRGPINLVVQAGNVTATGRLDSGASKCRCEMGSVKIGLEKGSSVRITAHTTIGKVAIEGDRGESTTIGQSGKEVTIGSGSGTLELECTMGNVRVTAE
jgi:Putative adhesin